MAPLALADEAAPAAGQLPLSAPDPVILVLGDSLSAGFGIDRGQGWVRLLEQRLAAQGLRYRLVNASISGETTAGGRSRLPRLLNEHRPQILILELGANDGLRGLSLGVMRDNLVNMVRLVRQADAQVLVTGLRLPPNYGASYIDGFQAVFREVATAEGVPLVPDFLAGVVEDRALMQADDVHPNALAQPRILDNVWPGLAPLLSQGRGQGQAAPAP